MSSLNNLQYLLPLADDMAAAACTMGSAPQNYLMFIEARDKFKLELENLQRMESPVSQ